MLKVVQKLVLDRARLQHAIDRGAQRALTRFGSFVWRRDKSSLKYETSRRSKSQPGQPPVVHRMTNWHITKTSKKTGQTSRQAASPLRELTIFSYDSHARSVVVGPKPFRSKVGAAVVPRTVEEGGQGPMVSHGKMIRATFKPRPHTGPAFKAELPQAPRLFAGVVR